MRMNPIGEVVGSPPSIPVSVDIVSYGVPCRSSSRLDFGEVGPGRHVGPDERLDQRLLLDRRLKQVDPHDVVGHARRYAELDRRSVAMGAEKAENRALVLRAIAQLASAARGPSLPP